MIWALSKHDHKAKPAVRGKARGAGGKKPQPRRRAVPIWRLPVVLGGVAVLVSSFAVGSAVWAWQTGRVAEAVETLRWEMITRAADFGFQVRDVQVTGRRQSSRDAILDAVQVTSGAPILAFDAEAARKRVEALPWVRTATVERRLPDTVLLHLIERRPAALWQDGGTFHLIDAEGVVIEDDDVGRFAGLLVVVGEGAPTHLSDLQVLLETVPTLMARVKSATWVGGRRWTLWMTQDEEGASIEVRLPEGDAFAAWQQLDRYHTEQKILDRDVSLIDLRLPDRITVRPRITSPKKSGKQAT